MKRYLIIASILLIQCSYAQIKDLLPSAIEKIELNPEGEKTHNDSNEALKKIEQKIKKGIIYDDLSKEEKTLYNNREDLTIPYYAIFGRECSWFCEDGHYEVSASSHLESDERDNYEAKNARDYNYKSVWIEGASNDGIGEYLIYSFKSTPADLLFIEIINGHVKSDTAYKNYARAKKLKMYINEVPYAILNLFDRRGNQTFMINSFPQYINKDNNVEDEVPNWTLKFEIIEIYKGLKSNDVVISEIFFDGIGVH